MWDNLLDYGTLQVIWWVLLGVLFAGFFIMDGFDLGTAMLMPIVARDDSERRILLKAIGPVWEGNQVWLILGLGAIFAAWPAVYSLVFSIFYPHMLLVLFALITRPVAIDYRSKLPNKIWRFIWDAGIATSGFIIPMLLGMISGALFLGLPFSYDPDMRLIYHNMEAYSLINPFTLFCGMIAVLLAIIQGAAYLMVKTEPPISHRCRSTILIITPILLLLSPLGAYLIYKPHVLKFIDRLFYTFALLSCLSLILNIWAAKMYKSLLTFVSNSWAIASTIATFGLSMFPVIVPSITDPRASLLVWNGSSSRNTLFIMLLVILIFFPIVLFYISWVYRVLRGKVTPTLLEQKSKNLY